MDHPDLLCDTLCCTDSALHMEISSQRYLHNNNLHSWQHPHFPIYWEAHFSLWEMLLAWHIKEQLLTTQKKKKNPNQPHKSSTSTLDKNVGELPAQVIARLCPHMTRKSFRCTFLEESQLSLKRPPMDHPVHVPCPQLPGWETPGLAAPFSQG